MKENEEFLKRNAKHVLDETVELINDAIDRLWNLTKKENAKELAVRQAMAFQVLHVLMPTSYSILANLLLGNIPDCFRDLRFMIESLAKCYLADLKYPHQTFFETKLKLLEAETKRKDDRRIVTKREHDFIEEFDKTIGLKGASVKLWGRLSQEAHIKRYTERVVGHVIRKNIPPGFALVIPMNYTEDELEILENLYAFMCKYRKILSST
jgi:hypothetical protein